VTRDEFLGLPTGIALGVLYDQMPQRMATVPKPPIPRPPKFDGKLSRKGGFCWMSEMDLDSLRYWHGKKSQGGKPEFADKDAKTTKELAYWIAWRLADPTTVWRGERFRVAVVAAPPSRDPAIHPWEKRGEQAPASGSTESDSDYFSGGSADDNNSNEYGF
jgi:hypothetical protein